MRHGAHVTTENTARGRRPRGLNFVPSLCANERENPAVQDVPMAQSKPLYYRAKQAAKLADCTSQAITKRIRRGQLAARRIGGRWYISASDVAKLVDLPIDQLPAPEAA